jgi:GT2 family glycosyltransferase
MTLYNNATHVREATDSILAQTRRDFALLMLDDGSSDEVEAMARQYERRDERVRYVRHPQRQGMVRDVEASRRDGAPRASRRGVLRVGQRSRPVGCTMARADDRGARHAPERGARLSADAPDR